MLITHKPQIKFFWMLLNMNEYIEHLKQDDAMMSSSLQDVVMPISSRSKSENSDVPRSGAVSILCADDSVSVVPRTFSLNKNHCEITIDTGTSTLKKIQAMLGRECFITFYDANHRLELVEYQVDNANSAQMITTLKFFVVDDPN